MPSCSRRRPTTSGKISTPTKRQQDQHEFISLVLQFKDMASMSEARTTSATALDSLTFPRYVIIGDQSSGKTSLISRLAGMPLGFTANMTGTRRLFQYVMQYGPAMAEPEIWVQDAKVREPELFATLRRHNEDTGGSAFSEEMVTVRIKSSKVSNIIIVDTPGLKDASASQEDSQPEVLLKQVLADPLAVPVVVLEPRDVQQTHAVFKVLAELDRKSDQIIVVVNKVDEKILPRCHWDSAGAWSDYWRAILAKGFKVTFLAAWPTGCPYTFWDSPLAFLQNTFSTSGPVSRDSPDSAQRCQMLVDSFTQEQVAFDLWQARMKRQGAGTPAPDSLGLAAFTRFLAKDQAEHTDQFCRAFAQVKDILETRVMDTHAKAQDDHKYYVRGNGLADLVYELVDIQARTFAQVLVGGLGDIKFDQDGGNCFRTLDQDINELREGVGTGKAMLLKWAEELELPEQYREYLERLVERLNDESFCGDIQELVDHDKSRLCGGAQLKRDEDVTVVLGFFLMLLAANEFDDETIENRMGEGKCWDNGNKVLKAEVQSATKRSFHPLVDFFVCILRKHCRSASEYAQKQVRDRSCDSNVFRKIKKTMPEFDDVTFCKDFSCAVHAVLDSELKTLADYLHKMVDDDVGVLGYQKLFLLQPKLSQDIVDNRTGFSAANSLFAQFCKYIDDGLRIQLNGGSSDAVREQFEKRGGMFLGMAICLLKRDTHPAMTQLRDSFKPTMPKKSWGGYDMIADVDLEKDFQEQQEKIIANANEVLDLGNKRRRLAGSSMIVQSFDLKALQLQFSFVMLANHSNLIDRLGSSMTKFRDCMCDKVAHQVRKYFNERDRDGNVRVEAYCKKSVSTLRKNKESAKHMMNLFQKAEELYQGLCEEA